MEFPRITPWSDARLDVAENMKVVQAFRFNKDGEIIKKKPGDEIKGMKGELKKDLYHQLKICYPEDFKKLTEFFESQKGKASDYNVPPQVAKATDVQILTGKLAELTKLVESQQKTIASLEKGGK